MAGGAYSVPGGRTILEILREHLDILPADYKLGVQHAIAVITSPYTYAPDWRPE